MKTSLGFFLLASVVFVASENAFAGFQFTAPIEQLSNQLTPVPNVAPPMPSVPAVKVQQEPVSITPKQQHPVVQSAPTPARAITETIMATTSDIAVGFGKNLPLATALKQVIPQNYTYVMDDEVEIGGNVSWNGGKPWPQVLNEMLQPLGVIATVDGKIVRVINPNTEEVRVPQVLDTSVIPPRPESVVSTAPLPRQVNSVPQNIIHSRLKDNSVVLSSTEPEPGVVERSIIPEVTEGQWMAQGNGSLKTVLESWSNLEGVDLFWSADYDYRLVGNVNISGNFEQAVEELLRGFSDATPKPTGRLHPNLPHGPAVLVIEAAGVK